MGADFRSGLALWALSESRGGARRGVAESLARLRRRARTDHDDPVAIREGRADAGQPHHHARPAGSVARNQRIRRAGRPAPGASDRETHLHQSDVSRALSHRHACGRSRPENRQPHLSVHRSEGSTELYARVGDLVAYELVRGHFRLLTEIVAAERGAVVKTIGDAVMATFSSPERALAAALRMRASIGAVGQETRREDLILKIGIHEGPCLAVMLNDRLDYFGQTVNIAARVQGLAVSDAMFATKPVIDHPQTAALLAKAGITPRPQQATLKGVAGEVPVYEIP